MEFGLVAKVHLLVSLRCHLAQTRSLVFLLSILNTSIGGTIVGNSPWPAAIETVHERLRMFTLLVGVAEIAALETD